MLHSTDIVENFNKLNACLERLTVEHYKPTSLLIELCEEVKENEYNIKIDYRFRDVIEFEHFVSYITRGKRVDRFEIGTWINNLSTARNRVSSIIKKVKEELGMNLNVIGYKLHGIPDKKLVGYVDEENMLTESLKNLEFLVKRECELLNFISEGLYKTIRGIKLISGVNRRRELFDINMFRSYSGHIHSRITITPTFIDLLLSIIHLEGDCTYEELGFIFVEKLVDPLKRVVNQTLSLKAAALDFDKGYVSIKVLTQALTDLVDNDALVDEESIRRAFKNLTRKEIMEELK